MTSVGSSCGTANVYLAPPKWYTQMPPGTPTGLGIRPQTSPIINQ